MATAGNPRRPRGEPLTLAEPVFLMKRDIPEGVDQKFLELDICHAAEVVSGKETIGACQNYGSMYRLYATNRTARAALLTQSISLYQTSINVYDKNPYVLRDNGDESPTTRVLIGEIPLSVSGDDIETALTRVGCVLRSKLIEEHFRDRDNKLTRFATGRRFIFISMPSTPLEKTLRIGRFTASIYHKEQKMNRDPNRPCGRCLQPGHTRFTCQNEVVCRECHLPGHMRGDASCTAAAFPPLHDAHEAGQPSLPTTTTAASYQADAANESSEGSTETESESEGESFVDTAESPALTSDPPAPTDPASDPAPLSTQNSPHLPPENEKETENKKKKKKKKKKEEGRKEEESRGRQLQTTLNFETRPRSQTPSTKRGREQDGDTPDRPDDKVLRSS